MRQSVKIKRGDAVALLWWLSVAAFVGDKGIDASDVPHHILLGFVLFCYNNHPYVLHTAGMVTETFFCISTIESVLPTSKAKYLNLCIICCVWVYEVGLKNRKKGQIVFFLERPPSVRFLETVQFYPQVLIDTINLNVNHFQKDS